MLRVSRLVAVLLAGLAVPALAQTANTVRPATPTVAVRPTAPITTPPSAPRGGAATAAAPASPSVAVSPAPSAKRIDVNSASEQDLDSLPGIGPAIAGNIIKGRPWDDLTDLVKKKAVPQAVFDRNKDRLALANINTSSAADMARTLPGIGEKTAPEDRQRPALRHPGGPGHQEGADPGPVHQDQGRDHVLTARRRRASDSISRRSNAPSTWPHPA